MSGPHEQQEPRSLEELRGPALFYPSTPEGMPRGRIHRSSRYDRFCREEGIESVATVEPLLLPREDFAQEARDLLDTLAASSRPYSVNHRDEIRQDLLQLLAAIENASTDHLCCVFEIGYGREGPLTFGEVATRRDQCRALLKSAASQPFSFKIWFLLEVNAAGDRWVYQGGDIQAGLEPLLLGVHNLQEMAIGRLIVGGSLLNGPMALRFHLTPGRLDGREGGALESWLEAHETQHLSVQLQLEAGRFIGGNELGEDLLDLLFGDNPGFALQTTARNFPPGTVLNVSIRMPELCARFLILQSMALSRSYSLFGEGNNYFMMGDLARAMAYFNGALELVPLVEAYCNRGVVRSHMGDLQGALSDLDLALSRDPDNKIALYSKGSVFSSQGQLDRAVHLFRRVLEIDPEFGQGLSSLGDCLRRLDRPREAIPFLDRALAGAQGDEEDFFPYFHRGACYRSLGQVERAVQDFRGALSIGAMDPVLAAEARAYIEENATFYVLSREGLPREFPLAAQDASLDLEWRRFYNMFRSLEIAADPLEEYNREQFGLSEFARVVAVGAGEAEHRVLLFNGPWDDDRTGALLRHLPAAGVGPNRLTVYSATPIPPTILFHLGDRPAARFSLDVLSQLDPSVKDLEGGRAGIAGATALAGTHFGFTPAGHDLEADLERVDRIVLEQVRPAGLASTATVAEREHVPVLAILGLGLVVCGLFEQAIDSVQYEPLLEDMTLGDGEELVVTWERLGERVGLSVVKQLTLLFRLGSMHSLALSYRELAGSGTRSAE